MNVALRLLASAGVSGPQDRLVRVNSGERASLGGALTLNFVESTPLDSTHLLVAAVFRTQPAVAYSGWTQASGGVDQTDGSMQFYARQGDGTVNGITIPNSTTANRAVFLMAFSGFVSATPAVVANSLQDTTPPWLTRTLPSTPSIYGIALAVAMVEGAAGYLSGTSAWDNGFTLTGSNPGSVRAWPGRKEYVGGSSSLYATNFTCSGIGPTADAFTHEVVYELTP